MCGNVESMTEFVVLNCQFTMLSKAKDYIHTAVSYPESTRELFY